jgi:uncharacterized protein
LGGLIYLGEVGKEKKSLIHRYRFSPQDHALDHAREVHDPRTGKSAGDLVTIDELEYTIDLKRGIHSLVPHPLGLIPRNVVDSDVIRDSLLRLGAWVADNGLDEQGPFRAQRDLLLRRVPRSLISALPSVIDNNG